MRAKRLTAPLRYIWCLCLDVFFFFVKIHLAAAIQTLCVGGVQPACKQTHLTASAKRADY